VDLADTLQGCRAILDGACDDFAESSVYMVGTLEDARAKEKRSREKRGATAAARPAAGKPARAAAGAAIAGGGRAP
jgi:F-type H+-transporting ATPase subunit beta